MVQSILVRFRLLSPREKRSWIALTAIGVALAAVETTVGGLVYALVALLTNPGAAEARPLLQPLLKALPSGSLLSKTLALLTLTGAIHLARSGLSYVLNRAHLRLASEATFALACRLFSHYLHSPYLFHVDRNSTDMRLHVEYGSANVFSVLNGAIAVLTHCLTALGLFGLVLYISPWPATAIALATAVTLFLFMRWTRGLVATSAKVQLELQAQAARYVQEGLASVRETKVLGRESFFAGEYARNKAVFLEHALRLHGLNALPRVLVELVFGIGLLIAVAVAALSGHETLTALLSLYAYAGIRAVPATLAVATELATLRYHIGLTEPLLADLAATSEGTKTPTRAPIHRGIEAEGIGFSYPGAERATLQAASLRVEKGSFIGIVGLSGAGKTTFADILLGLLEPSGGEIRIDGRPLGPRERLAAGYVPQRVYLSDDTLRRNIAFARSDADIDDERVRDAIRRVGLEPLVRELEDGIETRLKENGARLSGGERQRVALARALYDRPDLLVLDEATSALDPASERDMIETLSRLKGEHTIVIISHRISSIERCDAIHVMVGGRFVASGAYEHLARTSPDFRSWAGLGPAS